MFAVLRGVVASSFGREEIITSAYIDNIDIEEIQSADTGDPTMVIGRVDESINLNAVASLGGVELPSGVDYTWEIYNSNTLALVDTLTGKSPTFTIGTAGEYDIVLTADSLNILDRHFRRGIVIRPARFTEGTADVVIDLNQLRLGTWTNPLSDMDDTQGSSSVLDFNDVSRPDLKIAMKGTFSGTSLTIQGLRGTSGHPVIIQNVGGPANFISVGSAVIFFFTTGCQYIDIDGSGTSDRWGFTLTGRTTAGSQSQLLYFRGNFIRGLRVIACDFDQKRNQGASDGGTCVGWNTCDNDDLSGPDCNGNFGDPGFWDGDYVEIFGCRIRNAWDEGFYIGHFNDSNDASGFRPYRTGNMKIYRCSVNFCGRDPYQISNSNSMELHDNYGADNARESSSSHNSAISFNDGHRGNAYVYRNYFEEVDIFCSLQNGFVGDGNYKFYSNFCAQRNPTRTNPPQTMFNHIEANIACHIEVIYNTFICPDVNSNFVAMQMDSPSTFFDGNFKYHSNVMQGSGADDSPYPELRDIGIPSAGNRAGWVVDNVYRRTGSEAELLLDADYKPASASSPVYGAGVDPTSLALAGGNRDFYGYPMLIDRGGLGTDYTAGCFSGVNLYIVPDTSAPVLVDSDTTNITGQGFTIHTEWDEGTLVFYVVVANGAAAPSAVDVFAGHANGGGAPLASGNNLSLEVISDLAVTGLSAETAYDIYVIGEDGGGNQQTSPTLIDVTTGSAGVQFVSAGTGTSRGTTGALSVPYPSSFAAGDLLLVQVSIHSATGVISTPAGWTVMGGGPYQISSTDSGMHGVYGKIADGSESGTLSVSFSTDSGVCKMGRMYSFTNVFPSIGSLTESASEGHANSATVSARSLTATNSRSLGVQFVVVIDDNAFGAFTGATGGTYIEATPEFTTTDGNDGCMSLQIVEFPSAGSVTGGSYVMAGADGYNVTAFVILPEPLP